MSLFAFGALSLATWNLPAVTTDVWPYVLLFAAVGAPGVIMIAGLMSVLQEQSEPRQRGAVFAAVGLVSAVGQALGILLGALSDGAIGLLPLLEVQGCLYLLGGVIALLWLPRAVDRPTSRAESATDAVSRTPRSRAADAPRAQSTFATAPCVSRTSSSIGHREDGVRRAAGRPDLGIAGEVLVDDGAQRRRMPRGGDAADRLAGGLAHLLRRRTLDLAEAETRGERCGVDAVGAARHDEERLAVAEEDQAVGDRADLDPEGRRPRAVRWTRHPGARRCRR